MKAVLKREISSYFTTMIGYIFIALILLTCGIFTYLECFKLGSPQFQYVVNYVQLVFFLAIPVLTMRSIADERYQKTDQLLFSLPMKISKIVIGKYLAMVTILAVPTLIMCFVPPIISLYGKISFFTAYSSLFGFFILGCALLAIGLFISSVSGSQVIAAIISFFVMLFIMMMSMISSLIPTSAEASLAAIAVIILIFAVVLYVMTKSYPIAIITGGALGSGLAVFFILSKSSFEGLFGKIVSALSLYDRCYTFYDGIFDLKTVIYYFGIIAIFLFLTTQAVEKRRWS